MWCTLGVGNRRSLLQVKEYLFPSQLAQRVTSNLHLLVQIQGRGNGGKTGWGYCCKLLPTISIPFCSTPPSHSPLFPQSTHIPFPLLAYWIQQRSDGKAAAPPPLAAELTKWPPIRHCTHHQDNEMLFYCHKPPGARPILVRTAHSQTTPCIYKYAHAHIHTHDTHSA